MLTRSRQSEPCAAETRFGGDRSEILPRSAPPKAACSGTHSVTINEVFDGHASRRTPAQPSAAHRRPQPRAPPTAGKAAQPNRSRVRWLVAPCRRGPCRAAFVVASSAHRAPRRPRAKPLNRTDRAYLRSWHLAYDRQPPSVMATTQATRGLNDQEPVESRISAHNLKEVMHGVTHLSRVE